MVRGTTLENVLYKGPGALAHGLGRQWVAVRLLDLPAVLDAVVDKSHEAGSDNDIGDVGDGLDDAAVADPHVARGHPAAGALVVVDLVRGAGLGDDVGDCGVGGRVTILDEMEGDDAEVLVEDALPLVLVTPPLELVALVVLAATARDVDAGVV